MQNTINANLGAVSEWGKTLELKSAIKISALASICFDVGFLRYSNVMHMFSFALRMKHRSESFSKAKNRFILFCPETVHMYIIYIYVYVCMPGIHVYTWYTCVYIYIYTEYIYIFKLSV